MNKPSKNTSPLEIDIFIRNWQIDLLWKLDIYSTRAPLLYEKPHGVLPPISLLAFLFFYWWNF